MNLEKEMVRDFWNKASCGEDLLLPGIDRESYGSQSKLRYQLEPYIRNLARFEESKGKRILEIGVGLGADHQCFAEGGAELFGIDLTERAVEHTRRRFEVFNLESQLAIGDAEHLEFKDGFFDVVYSWGVLHHSPNTQKAISEVFRVLKPGGTAKIMIYHKWSMIGFMLWIRYALFRFKPWTSLEKIYSNYLESPGTKAYSVVEGRILFSAFRSAQIHTVLTHGDLLESEAGQRHKGLWLNLARLIWPRWFLKRLFPSLGLFMLIEAKK